MGTEADLNRIRANNQINTNPIPNITNPINLGNVVASPLSALLGNALVANSLAQLSGTPSPTLPVPGIPIPGVGGPVAFPTALGIPSLVPNPVNTLPPNPNPGLVNNNAPNTPMKRIHPVSIDTLTDAQFESHVFYILDIQTALNTDSVMIPLEIAACAISAEKGEISSFHKFVDPGVIPTNQLGSVLYQKEIRHGLPHVKFELTEKSYINLYRDLCSFMDYNEKSHNKPQPSLYGGASTYMLTQCLEWICKKAGMSENIFGPVKSIVSLMDQTYKITSRGSSGNKVTSAHIMNHFTTGINNEVKLFKCRHHIKLETERANSLSLPVTEDMNSPRNKGHYHHHYSQQLQCSLAHVRYLGHLTSTSLSREIKRKIAYDLANPAPVTTPQPTKSNPPPKQDIITPNIQLQSPHSIPANTQIQNQLPFQIPNTLQSQIQGQSILQSPLFQTQSPLNQIPHQQPQQAQPSPQPQSQQLQNIFASLQQLQQSGAFNSSNNSNTSKATPTIGINTSSSHVNNVPLMDSVNEEDPIQSISSSITQLNNSILQLQQESQLAQQQGNHQLAQMKKSQIQQLQQKQQQLILQQLQQKQ
eukprot:TRINITY_DN6635_c0_g1_i1.p1 TRINITY_DN6635_c0_g1~~TRINITY_DN6635_c0_g1_i1.p1  ORF type:complete len:668 (+),score=137.83 TRINITY_DN6635_c0_g1_i1:243-2006(+)